MKRSAAEIIREYGPFPGADKVHGVTCDGRRIWFAAGDRLTAVDPENGETLHSIEVAADAGTAFDGRPLFPTAGDRVQKIDPGSGEIVATIPAPGRGSHSRLARPHGSLRAAPDRHPRPHQHNPHNTHTP